MKAVLVFCEGQHDVIFVQRSLGAIAGCHWPKWNTRPVRELPTPFGANESARQGLIAKRAADHHLVDLNLREIAHGPLPSFESVLEHEPSETLYVLVRMQGQDQTEGVARLVEQIKALAGDFPVETFEVEAYAIAFLFDADVEGMAAALEKLRQSFSRTLPGIETLRNAGWTLSGTLPVGCFLFHRDGEETGTLEDHLAPMVEAEWPQRTQAAREYITAYMADDDPVAKRTAERLKAVITTAGQFHQPGKPMSVILGHNSLPRKHFETSDLCKALTDFLTSIPWPEIAVG